MDVLKMLKGINIIETLRKLNKAIPFVIDFVSTHQQSSLQFLLQMREYAEKTGRNKEFQALVEIILEIGENIKKEGKNG
jgi:hypothetical protein